MEREAVVDDGALEKFRERLEHWDNLCSQLRELYCKYLDLAAFRSEKCYFPSRKCRRSWNRQYDVDDLTLMWIYIANTVPLCGKLMRALAEVEYEIRKRALESLEKYGGVKKRTNPSGKYEIVGIQLKRSVYGYLVLRDGKLYVIWGEFDSLSKKGQLRAAEVERRVADVIGRYKRGEKVDTQIDELEIDDEYRRLWLEVPLPEGASKLLGGKAKAPVALFRNLGWLLSDDSRFRLEHTSSNPGQVAMRIFDWIAMAMYAKRASQTSPLVFRLSVHQVARTKDGINPSIEVRAVGTMAKIIRTIYKQLGITLGKPKEVLARGYAVLNALREEAFKREGLTYVVDNVGAWLAFSATVTILVLGDGYITQFMLGIVAKSSSETTLKGKAVGVRELAKALGGSATAKEIRLQGWYMRLLLPAPPTPSFEKTVKLYDVFANYPAAVTIEINGATYLLAHNGNGRFIIGKEKSAELYEAVKRLGLRVEVKKDGVELMYSQLREMAKLVPVRLLNEMEKESVREVRPVPSFDLESVRRVLEEVVKLARITFGRIGKYKCIRIIPYDKSKLWEIAAMLKAAGIRISVCRLKWQVIVCEQKSVEAIQEIVTHLFSHAHFPQTVKRVYSKRS